MKCLVIRIKQGFINNNEYFQKNKYYLYVYKRYKIYNVTKTITK